MGIEQDCVSCDPKLFVGQLPLDVSSDDLFPVFSKFGAVDKVDVLGNGSAMVWMGRWTDAERALEAAEAGDLKLAGKKKPVVRIADPPRRGFHLAGIKPKKLFVGQVPRNVVEEELRALFQQFGKIVEFEMPQPRQPGQGRGGFSNTGCAFVRFGKWAEAENAIAQLHERHQFPESRRPLVVKFADAKPIDKSRSMGVLGGKRPLSPDLGNKMCKRMGPADSLGINMAMGLVTMNSNTMSCGLGDPLSLGFLASQMGPPMGANSMCGMGRLDIHNGSSHTMSGKIPAGPSSMDLDRCPPNLLMEMQVGTLTEQDNRKFSGGSYCDARYLRGYLESPNGVARMGMGMGPGIRDYDDRVMNEMCMNSMASSASFNNRKLFFGSNSEQRFSNSSNMNVPGCQLGRSCPDEAREHTLFVGQIPHEAQELDLWHLFSKIGEVLELNILRRDGKSRGAAFVTYSCVEMANEAIEKINGTPIPWDVTGRKLAVRFKDSHSQRNSCQAE